VQERGGRGSVFEGESLLPWSVNGSGKRRPRVRGNV
jgi:hypothetical protein